MENTQGFTRRNFLKGAGLGAAGLAAVGLAGCSPSQRPSAKRWARTRREPSRKKRSLRFTARITGRRPCRWPRIR